MLNKYLICLKKLLKLSYYIFRYHEIFFMVDTCQAQSMHQEFYSPNILAVGSSKVGEDSLSVSQVVNMHKPPARHTD